MIGAGKHQHSGIPETVCSTIESTYGGERRPQLASRIHPDALGLAPTNNAASDLASVTTLRDISWCSARLLAPRAGRTAFATPGKAAHPFVNRRCAPGTARGLARRFRDDCDLTRRRGTAVRLDRKPPNNYIE